MKIVFSIFRYIENNVILARFFRGCVVTRFTHKSPGLPFLKLNMYDSGISGMGTISDVPCYIVLNHLTLSLLCIAVY